MFQPVIHYCTKFSLSGIEQVSFKPLSPYTQGYHLELKVILAIHMKERLGLALELG